METVLKDIRFGVRNLLKHPTFAITALLTLAIGIGANTTIFSFVNGILLRPLPYPDSERLVVINETAHKRGIPSMSISFPNFLDWRGQNHLFEDISAYGQSSSFSLTGAGEPERLEAHLYLKAPSSYCASLQSWVGHSRRRKIDRRPMVSSFLAMIFGSVASLETLRSSARTSSSTIVRAQ